MNAPSPGSPLDAARLPLPRGEREMANRSHSRRHLRRLLRMRVCNSGEARPSERNLVVELLVEGAALAAGARKRARTPKVAVALVALAHAVALAVEHGELAAVLLEHDFGRIAVL